VTQVSTTVLSTVVLPLWVVAGLADWWCHRRSHIEHTSGLRENGFHWALFAIVAIGAVAAATLAPNRTVLAVLIGVFVLHELLAFSELKFVTTVRSVAPFEQMVHSFLEILPLVVVGILAVESLGSAAAEAPEWTLRIRGELKVLPLLLAGAVVVLFNVVPLLEETWRCLRATRAKGASGRSTRIVTGRRHWKAFGLNRAARRAVRDPTPGTRGT
jgi:hypothetical protein